jgi:hypothetical protein
VGVERGIPTFEKSNSASKSKRIRNSVGVSGGYHLLKKATVPGGAKEQVQVGNIIS